MTRKPRGRPSPASGGEDEGYELWDIIKSRVEPLTRGRDRIHPASEPGTRHPPPKSQTRTREPAKAAPPPRSAAAPAPAPPRTPPASFEIERKKARRLSGGKLPIEAVLDLHGMRQDEARAALVRFLHHAQARRLKFVKIITGKGAAGRQPGAFADSWSEPELGVLRRQVPLWLAESDLRALVVGTSAAGQRHGGSGALYVELRRRETKPR